MTMFAFRLRGWPLRILAAAVLLGSLSGFAHAEDLDTLIQKGKSIATAADCMACHTVPHKGKPFAGGYGIVSPLGTIYSTNITPSKTHGIGSYTEEDFSQAVRKGIRKDGGHLYPAMPYDAYAEITDADLHALYTYFMHGVTPVDDEPVDHTALPFPFNMRFSMTFWNLLYATKSPFIRDDTKGEELNRGAYLAGALGHCSSCHTPRGPLMGEVSSGYLAGGPVGPWFAPNITSDPVSGIGGWSVNELVQYFGTGHVDGKNQAAGGMAEAVQNSLQHLPKSDLRALAVYLKSVPPVRDSNDKKPAYAFGGPLSDEAFIRGAFPSNSHNSLKTGAELYNGYCASCHQPSGEGSEDQTYPSLFHNTATGSSQTANLVSTILYGVEREADGRDVLMPGFGKQSFVNALSDQQVADISNYVLNRFGNPDAHVTVADVATARAGGPAPLLAVAQPFILPAMLIASIALVGAVAISLFIHRRKKAVVESI